jgi:hypothetical protein
MPVRMKKTRHADLVVETMLPLTVSVASATAAILGLIDMRDSIRLRAAVVARLTSWTERA